MSDQSVPIEFKNTTLHYGGSDIVKDVNFHVKKGETKIVLGPSGVGKSTILKATLGLLKPKLGHVYIHGHDLYNISKKEQVKLRTQMAMVFQHGALFDAMTVGENVSFRLRELRLATHEQIRARTIEVLQFVGLGGVIKLRPSQLSGGMKKRVAIARALAPDPECFLFDEPTVGLDPVNTYNIEQLILKLKKRKATMIVVTHDIGSAIRLADSILMVHEGRFIFEGSGDELKNSQDPRIKSFLDPAITQYIH